jgi:hypothetical protein
MRVRGLVYYAWPSQNFRAQQSCKLSIQKLYLIVRGGVERCECVSCIAEAVRHHAYVFLLHAVAAAAVAGTTNEDSGVKGW